MFDNIPIFCINLKRDMDRKKYMSLQLNKFNHTFVDAVNGMLLNQETLQTLISNSQKSYVDKKTCLQVK